MKISILVPGKSKEKYWEEARKEYMKRLAPFVDLSFVYVQEQKPKGKLSPGEIDKIKAKEAQSILEKVPCGSYLVLLDLEGKQISSETFASFLEEREVTSTRHLVFVIGGFLGLDEDLKKKANFLLSFSKMTFTHQMMPVLLLEQIYRGYSIMKNLPYHK